MLRRHPDGEKTGNPLALARSRQAQPEHHRCERHRHSCPRPLVRSARALAPYEPSPAPRRTPLVRAMGVLMTRLNRLLTIRQACRNSSIPAGALRRRHASALSTTASRAIGWETCRSLYALFHFSFAASCCRAQAVRAPTTARWSYRGRSMQGASGTRDRPVPGHRPLKAARMSSPSVRRNTVARPGLRVKAAGAHPPALPRRHRPNLRDRSPAVPRRTPGDV